MVIFLKNFAFDYLALFCSLLTQVNPLIFTILFTFVPK